MRSGLPVLAALPFLAAALVGAACSDDPTAPGIPLTATLTGAAEVPGPGDTDGSGSARVRLDRSGGRVCFYLEFTGIDAPTGGHIHRGGAGVAGEVVVGFFDSPTNT